MAELDCQIKEHENKIQNLTNRLQEVITIEEKFNKNQQMNQEKDFIISLYKIKTSIAYENQKNTIAENLINKNIKIKNKKTNKSSHSADLKIIKNKRSKSTHRKNTSETELTQKYLYQIENINNETSKKNSFEYEYSNKLVTKFQKKYEKGNYIYYECCKRRKGCLGKCKYDKKNKIWFMIAECSKNIMHDIISFDIFYSEYKNKNITRYDMSFKKYQEYFTKALFKENEANNFNDILMKFKQLFKKDFILTQKEVNDIKYNTIGKYNKLDFIELCNKIELEEDKKLEINTTDIKYNININNKLIERKEKIVIFTTLKMRELLNNSEIYNYFMDVTYKIIPKAQKPYKLMTITAVNNKNNTTNLCALIGIIYEDYLSFYYTLKYLNNFYNFEPKIIHIDFSGAERKALNMDSLFKRPPMVVGCFFLFCRSVFEKMKCF